MPAVKSPASDGGSTKTAKKKVKSRTKRTNNNPVPKDTAYLDLDFWHGLLPNEDTANLLKEDSSFLLRKNMDDSSPILLSVRSGDQVYNAVVQEKPTGYIISDRAFDTIHALVDYYQVRKATFNLDGHDITLGNAVRRKSWELRHSMVCLQKELGSGSYGVVHLATLTYPRNKPITVAAKMLTNVDSEALQALWKEARVMQEYDHPNITKFYGVCNDALPYYLVMEFVKGGSVDCYLEKNPTLSVYKRTKIAAEAAAGLEYLHSRQCIHRDIAARNLLIDKIAKVADFGLARKTKNYKVDPDKPMNLRWISPEVFETAVVDQATDVYAYGVTLFELFVVPYTTPYADWDAGEVYSKVVEKGYRLSPPPDAPHEISGLMKECLLEPKLRPSFKMIYVFLQVQVKTMAKNPDMTKDIKMDKKKK